MHIDEFKASILEALEDYVQNVKDEGDVEEEPMVWALDFMGAIQDKALEKTND